MNGTVSVRSVPFPHDALGADTVVIKPRYLGICRADTKEVVGSRDIPTDRGPLFGHELVGFVAFAGADTGFTEGERVTFNPNVTPNRTTGFAEYLFVRGTAPTLDRTVVRSPDILDDIWMPEPFACIVHAVRKLLELVEWPSFDGRRVGVIGAGCSGLMFAMYAKHLGASVVVFNRGEMRRDFAADRKLLAADEIAPLDQAAGHAGEFDVVIVVPTIATPALLAVAGGLAADGGVLQVYGGTRKGDRFPGTDADVDTIRRRELLEPVAHQGKLLHVSGAYGCGKEDYEEAFRLHAEHPDDFPLARLVSRRISLAEFPELVTAIAAETVDHPGKVVIDLAR
ncbi:alcohol dehydrogenase catalytic domain-containing protein [Nocardia sp. NRRL S-836]|uniref:alcohol dehydrogenase catalytic domain-containing protein n=1 Tax=Nocardia sp. NRRL S-836 TaxID=1519492 RepID=UPI0018D0DEAE|nr:alcohol dehydrogenase catalytic domain-containing protein [Nocardia sp. NRRL S-836]